MDLTTTFRSLQPNAPKPNPYLSSPFFRDASTLFTSLLTVHRNMLTLRKPYLALSTSPTHISALDSEAKAIFSSVQKRLSEFEKAEKLRRMLEDEKKKRDWKRGFKGLLRGETEEDEGEGAENVRREVRDAVIWVLSERLTRVNKVMMGMQEERMGRAVGRLENSGFAGGRENIPAGYGEGSKQAAQTSTPAWMQNAGNGLEEGEVSNEMVQQLELENREMVRGFEGMMEGVRSVSNPGGAELDLTLNRNAEKSLIEISNLQLQLAANLSTQEAHLNQLVTDSMETTENLEKGNKQLKEAAKKASFARSFFWGSVGFATLAVMWDLIV